MRRGTGFKTSEQGVGKSGSICAGQRIGPAFGYCTGKRPAFCQRIGSAHGICVFLGYEADEAFGLGHTGRLIGIVFGFPAAMYSLYRQLKKGGLV